MCGFWVDGRVSRWFKEEEAQVPSAYFAALSARLFAVA